MDEKQPSSKEEEYTSIGLAKLVSYMPSPSQEAEKRVSVIKPESRSSQISGTYGHFSPGFKTGMFDSSLPMPLQQHVDYHEQNHANGTIDGSPQGEYWADAIAAERTGNPDLIRGPFYRGPVRR